METRSIDTAKDASINLMTLNKKVVNLRAVVKRTKVHVISKLTRNIEGLKKKKGTDEEKEKNLKKAQRCLDEIQSIRSLKEDKITKYSIANVSTFEDVSKATLSPLSRALARLADHQIMKEAVAKFRDDHSDWRDLAAFMLMQQTGRKFKSQKDKKLITRAENINASKLMTKAYTEGLFREDGFQKIEENLEKKKKRKKKKQTNKDTEEATGDVNALDKINEESETRMKEVKRQGMNEKKNNKESVSIKEEDEDLVKAEVSISNDHGQKKKQWNVDKKNNKQRKNLTQKNVTKHVTTSQIISNKFSNNNDIEKPASDSELGEEEESRDEEEMEEGDSTSSESDESVQENESVEEHENDSEEEDSDDEQTYTNVEEKSNISETSEPPSKISKRNNECVVKQLNIGAKDSDSESVDEEEMISSSDKSDESDEEVSGNEDTETSLVTSKRQIGKVKRGKAIPDFLMENESRSNKLPRDPFFEGSDMEDNFNDFEEEENDDVDDSDIHVRFKGNKETTKSLFYRPGENKKTVFTDRGGSFERGRGRGRGGRGAFDSRSGGGFQGGRHSHGEVRIKKSHEFGNNKKFDRTGKKDFGNSSHSSLSRSSTSSKYKSDSGVSSKPAEKLHPSWEASRKRKAEQSGGIKAFSGTKITFDDD